MEKYIDLRLTPGVILCNNIFKNNKTTQPSPENTQTRSMHHTSPSKRTSQSAQNLLKCPVFTDVHFPLENGSI